jgi:hypothetical protein
VKEFLMSAARFALNAVLLGAAALACGYGFAWASGADWTLPVVVLAVGASVITRAK